MKNEKKNVPGAQDTTRLEPHFFCPLLLGLPFLFHCVNTCIARSRNSSHSDRLLSSSPVTRMRGIGGVIVGSGSGSPLLLWILRHAWLQQCWRRERGWAVAVRVISSPQRSLNMVFSIFFNCCQDFKSPRQFDSHWNLHRRVCFCHFWAKKKQEMGWQKIYILV